MSKMDAETRSSPVPFHLHAEFGYVVLYGLPFPHSVQSNKTRSHSLSGTAKM